MIQRSLIITNPDYDIAWTDKRPCPLVQLPFLQEFGIHCISDYDPQQKASPYTPVKDMGNLVRI